LGTNPMREMYCKLFSGVEGIVDVVEGEKDD
jgi:hypothetical protein